MFQEGELYLELSDLIKRVAIAITTRFWDFLTTLIINYSTRGGQIFKIRNLASRNDINRFKNPTWTKGWGAQPFCCRKVGYSSAKSIQGGTNRLLWFL